uniref:Uncharacterized protein n=1 Tax=Anguilla anguilla TaxID=7936 RepID=A0A0E9RFZ3_ANGAN
MEIHICFWWRRPRALTSRPNAVILLAAIFIRTLIYDSTPNGHTNWITILQ